MTPLQTLAELNLPTLAGTVPGWCSPEAGWALYRMAMAAPEGTAVVEIGSWMGRSAVWLGWGAKHGACGVRVVTIPRAGHVMMNDDPPAFIEALAAALE